MCFVAFALKTWKWHRVRVAFLRHVPRAQASWQWTQYDTLMLGWNPVCSDDPVLRLPTLASDGRVSVEKCVAVNGRNSRNSLWTADNWQISFAHMANPPSRSRSSALRPPSVPLLCSSHSHESNDRNSRRRFLRRGYFGDADWNSIPPEGEAKGRQADVDDLSSSFIFRQFHDLCDSKLLQCSAQNSASFA